MKDLRMKIRAGDFTGPTSGVAGNKVQANLAILPKEYAFDFLLFAMRNPKAVPIIEVLEAGQFESVFAADSDIRTDIPQYNIYRDGVLIETVADIRPYWRDDLVSFLIGCSFTFEQAILDAGIRIKHIDQGLNVAMYDTNIPNQKAGVFAGQMVVSMRPFPENQVQKVIDITAQFPNMHGAPVHVGAPATIGITDIMQPDYGQAVAIDEGEVPVFWGCGVTPQNVAVQAKPSLMISHLPGHMFVLDIDNQAYLDLTNPK